mmetsp:Transcript_35235/g.85405  ORF Transcript_35235/g.85405 Transcript_35235/m.85405 type:complete len:130 (+) Transcript_35235:1675-2064(+)
MIEPPPLDPLDGLEIVVEGTFTVGKLSMVPSRRFRMGKNMFDIDIVVEDFEGGPQVTYAPTTDDEIKTEIYDHDDDEEALDLSKIQAEAEAAEKEAEEAAAEARRKAEKMEMLRKKAEEAMARRKQKNQ